MPEVEWPEELSTGLPEIDTQHRIMLVLCNHIIQALWAKQSEHKVSGMIESLLLVTKHHLDFEEKFMVEIGWPGIEDHRMDHTKLLMHVADMEQVLYTEGASWLLNMEALNSIKAWFSQHVAEHDFPLALYTKNLRSAAA